MKNKMYNYLKEAYWNLPFSDDVKDTILGKARVLVRDGKNKILRKDVKQNITDESVYVKQILATPKGSKEDFISESSDSYVRADSDAKVIAYYLTQFHPTEENDLWWGKGVTEWNNVCRAMPQYVGHYQPRIPGELGFYDLRLKDNIIRQTELAKKYGVYGFSFYFYWFDGVRLLDKPLDLFVDNKDIDFPFSLCWANESWTRRFDGSCGEILIEQSPTEESYKAFIDSAISYMKDFRYIKVNDKPMLTIYRPSFIPNCEGILSYWRERCREQGLGEIHLIGVKEHSWDADLIALGFDAQSEFHPGTVFKQCKIITDDVHFIQPEFGGLVVDYKDIVINKKYFNYDYDKLYRAAMPMWDNTARRDNKGMIFEGATPALYSEWLEDIIKAGNKRTDIEDNVIFINAWNEWGEGTYLEPDRRYGYAYLDATRKAIERSR
ncbi:glycosyltransferase WbsX family protein [Aeromonas encheleia]|uniref:Glycoside hydrolase family 99-like domain-containing protein n=1 Tax=Aeromonas encheleia TaxID=73010 RepID=A0AAE9MJR6_9GAMM|nr:glycoside hydrolase family 99-like domain-containing protein [Aeromonas encheleia]USV58816.1 glycoside hydrolase family 99-like domain-containing protein [Aeromonas encheleia]